MIAVRPPEYWPRLEYFALMQQVDQFVLADTFQYSRQSFQNRARVRNPQGWQWISVPLKGGQHGTPICKVRLRALRWTAQHWKALEFNYRSAPFFAYYEAALRDVLAQDFNYLGALTCATIVCVHDLLDLNTQLLQATELTGSPDSLQRILTGVGEDALLSPPEAAEHDARAVGPVQVFKYESPIYHQNFEGFEPGQSILDLLFMYGPEAGAILQQGVGTIRS